MTVPNANFMTIVEASAKLDKSPRTIHRWIEEGRLPGHKVEVDGQYRWVVDIDKVKAKDYATPKPPDAQAELLDLREEVAWLREQLAEKERERVKEVEQLHQESKAQLDAKVEQLYQQWKAQLDAKDVQIDRLHVLLQRRPPIALTGPKRWWQFWRRR
jgi:DNA-binding transcriptional MerR regulator